MDEATSPRRQETAQLIRAGGSFWLLVTDDWEAKDGSFQDPTLWRSTDALEWASVDLAPIAPNWPHDLGWRPSFGPVVTAGGTDAMALTFEARRAATFLGLPATAYRGQWVSLVSLGAGRYRALGGYGAELAVLRFEETSAGLRVNDDGVGAPLTELQGVGMAFIERWAANGEPGDSLGVMHIPIEHRVGVVIDGELATVELPGGGPGNRDFGLIGGDVGFSAFQLRPDGQLESWRSRDGVTWTAGELVGDDAGEPSDISGLTSGPDGLEVHGAFDRRVGREPTWVSVDGVDWQAAPPYIKGFVRIGPGWLALRQRRELVFHPDGGDGIVRVDAASLRLKWSTAPGFFFRGAISPNTFRYSVSNGVGRCWQRDHWIITFDDIPPSGPES